MKFLITTVWVMFFIGLSDFVHLNAQSLDIEGKVNIRVMDRATVGSDNVIRLDDGTLARRSFQIGDFAQGGIVFWVDESGEHGLVSAKVDQNSGIRWYAGTHGISQSKGNGPYSGEMNTAIIIASLVAIGDDGNSYAARVCSELQVTENSKTYGDWYLPSDDELRTMFDNRIVIGNISVHHGGEAFSNSLYWSSTESIVAVFSTIPVAIDFDDGTGYGISRDKSHRVRCIRAF